MPLVPTPDDQQPWWASRTARKKAKSQSDSNRSGKAPKPAPSQPSPSMAMEIRVAAAKRKALARTRKIRRISRAVFRLVLLGAILYGIIALVRYPGWRIAKVEFKGLEYVSRDELLKMLPIRIGGSLIFLNKKQIKQAAEKHPRIKAVDVDRKIPSTVAVNVTERKPYLDLVDGTRHIIVDSEGIVIDIASQALKAGTGKLNVRNTGKIIVGEPVPFEGAFDLMDFNKKVDPRVRSRVKGVVLSGDGEITVNTDVNVPFKVDVKQDWSRRLDLVPGILDRIEQDKLQVSFVDLRPSGAPYIRLLTPDGAGLEQKPAVNQ